MEGRLLTTSIAVELGRHLDFVDYPFVDHEFMFAICVAAFFSF